MYFIFILLLNMLLLLNFNDFGGLPSLFKFFCFVLIWFGFGIRVSNWPETRNLPHLPMAEITKLSYYFYIVFKDRLFVYLHVCAPACMSVFALCV